MTPRYIYSAGIHNQATTLAHRLEHLCKRELWRSTVHVLYMSVGFVLWDLCARLPGAATTMLPYYWENVGVSPPGLRSTPGIDEAELVISKKTTGHSRRLSRTTSTYHANDTRPICLYLVSLETVGNGLRRRSHFVRSGDLLAPSLAERLGLPVVG